MVSSSGLCSGVLSSGLRSGVLVALVTSSGLCSGVLVDMVTCSGLRSGVLSSGLRSGVLVAMVSSSGLCSGVLSSGLRSGVLVAMVTSSGLCSGVLVDMREVSKGSFKLPQIRLSPLLLVKQQMGNPPQMDTWQPDTYPCGSNGVDNGWYGVICKDGYIVGIDLIGVPGATSGIPALVSPALGEISTLQTIRLGGNPLMSGSLPRQWSILNNLVSVEIIESAAVGSLPPSWSTLTQLESISIVNNANLAGPLPMHCSSLVKLQSLTLAGNALTGGLASTWSNLESLTTLDLSNNLLTSTVPKAWGQEERWENLLALAAPTPGPTLVPRPLSAPNTRSSAPATSMPPPLKPLPAPSTPGPHPGPGLTLLLAHHLKAAPLPPATPAPINPVPRPLVLASCPTPSLRLDGNELMCGGIPIKLENLKPNLTTLFMASVDRDLSGSTN
eukprot:gene14897-20940_t